MPQQNKCPHPQCNNMKPLDQYACRRHWYTLPKSLQNKIWEGFKKGKLSDDWQRAHLAALEYWG
jgi:hypothetical protein